VPTLRRYVLPLQPEKRTPEERTYPLLKYPFPCDSFFRLSYLMPRNVGLGRGLDALFHEATPVTHEDTLGVNREAAGHVSEIPVDAIVPNPYQPRQDFEEEAMSQLVRSIEQLGIIQPLTIRALENGRFEVIAGERRLRAARRAGLRTVPAYVREADMEVMLEMALVENVQREDLNPIEIALGYQRLISECGLRQDEVARRVGKKRSTVANFLRLLHLPARLQAALRDKSISVGHARALIPVRDRKVQIQWMNDIIQEGLSVREVERRVKQLRSKNTPSGSPQQPKKERNPQLLEFENILRKRFSTKVQLRHNMDGRGKIELHYFSQDDLERVLDLLLRSV